MKTSPETKTFIFLGIFLLLALLYNSEDFLTKQLFPPESKPSRLSKNTAEFDLNAQPRLQTLYLSLGKTKGPCDIYLDGRLAQKNFINSAYKAGLNNYFIFKNTNETLRVECPPQKGFSGGLSFLPILTSHKKGLILQSIRSFLAVWLGPISSIILIFNVGFFSLGQNDENLARKRYAILMGVFGWISLAYFLSLSHAPRLLFSQVASTKLHICLKLLFSFTFLQVVLRRSRDLQKINTLLGSVFIGGAALSAILEYDYINYYKHSLTGILIISVLYAVATFRRSAKKFTGDSNQTLLYMWVTCLCIDTVNNYFNSSFYVSSFLSMFANFYLATQSKAILSFHESFNLYKASFIDALKSRITPQETVVKINEPQTRAALGLDLGIRPSETAPPFAEKLEETFQPRLKDELVSINSRGLIYTFSLSDPDNRQTFKKNIEELKSLLHLFSQKVENYFLSGGEKVYELLKEFNLGNNSTRMGYVYFDICDYKENNLKYSRCANAYSQFVDNVYFPQLISHLAPLAIPERTEGDQVQFFVIEREESPVNTQLVVEKIKEFLSSISPNLCIEHGYPPIKYTCSVHHGMANLIIDNHSVRTSGDVQNHGARMLASCPTDTIVISESLARLCPTIATEKEGILRITKRDIVQMLKLKMSA